MSPRFFLLLALIFAAAPLPAFAETVPAQAVALLEKRCLQCHGDKTAMSGLRLVAREQILQGGAHGPAIKPGNPSESLLFQAVTHAGKISMPPGGQLDPPEIELLRVWIEKGAGWPQCATHAPGNARARDWWAFRKPQRPAVPN